MIISLFQVKVFICAITIEQWRADAHLHDVLSQSLEEINRSSNSRIFSKSDKPTILLISYLFVIDQPDVVHENRIESWHVVGLCLS